MAYKKKVLTARNFQKSPALQEPLWQEIYRKAWPCKIQVLPLSQEEFGEQLDTGFIEPNKIIKPLKTKASTTF